MAQAIRPERKLTKILYDLKNTPKNQQQRNESNVTGQRRKIWQKETFK